MLLDSSFVHGFRRTNCDLLALDFEDLLDSDRVDRLERFLDRSFWPLEPQFLGVVKEPLPEIGMGDADQGQRSFLDVFAEEIDNTLFRGDIIDVVYVFTLVGDDSLGDQFHDLVGQILRMNPQVVFS